MMSPLGAIDACCTPRVLTTTRATHFTPTNTAAMGRKGGGGGGGGGSVAAKDQFTEVDPSTIYFSHSRIRTTFSGCGRKVESTLQDIIDGTLKPGDLPFITVMRNPATGHLFSINNRRLWVLKRCKERGLLGPEGVVRVRIKREDKRNPLRWSAETCSLEAKLCLK